MSIYTITTIPYERATYLWQAGKGIWLDNPRNALPSWMNLFLPKKLPETIILDTAEKQRGVTKIVVPFGKTMSKVIMELTFNYEYDDFPSEINLFYSSKFTSTPPQLTVYWVKPNGEKFKLKDLTLSEKGAYYISNDEELAKTLINHIREKLGEEPEYGITTEIALFAKEDKSILKKETVSPLKGKYRMAIEGMLFEKDSDVNVKLVVYGKVYGMAGTDHLRRDLMIALLWGTPIALSFGMTAALSIAVLQMIIAATSAWFGGRVDFILQRLTEINMTLPFLPILIMIAVFYKLNIWTMLLVIVALSIFGSGVKTYRAVFLQVKEFPYIDAARSYGASSLRIIFLYIIPKILPTIIPSLVLSVPDFVFLEAALAILGLGDPVAPTWGKIIDDAFSAGALYKGYFYWVLEPSFLLILTALGFALLGLSLDKIFNPRLKEV
ncbi:MAG: ABC transporter permease [Thaumarchaeota archaeon]|nr:ABC transporter permease [Nitrososphaerota archaeon]